MNAVGRPDWKALLALTRGHRRLLLTGGVAAAIRSLLLMAASVAIGRLVTPGGLDRGIALVLIAAGCTIATGLVSYAARVSTIRAVKRIVSQLRQRLVECTLTLSPRAVEAQGRTQLRHRLAQDSEKLDYLLVGLLGEVLPATVTSAAILLFLLYLSPPIGLVATALYACLFLLRRRSARRMRVLADEAQATMEELDQGMALLLHRHALAKTSAAEPFERAERSAQINDVAHRTTRIATGMARLFEQEATQAALAVLLLVVALIHLPRDMLSIEQLAPILFLLVALRGTVNAVMHGLRDAAGAMPALIAIQTLLKPEEASHVSPGKLPPDRWNIEARQLDLRPLFHSVDLRLRQGEMVVLTGANGSGKTTLVNILLGLIPPQAGSIMVDGHPLNEVDLQAYRLGIGHVPQHPILFSGSIAENIAYADSDMPHERIAWAAALSGVAAFADRRPGGLSSRMGDDGERLSGGQRQRVAIARALARKPHVLILDEPTNHLDAAGVEELAAMLRTIPDAPAILVISHDPAMLAAADRHYHLANGVLATSGETSAVIRSVA